MRPNFSKDPRGFYEYRFSNPRVRAFTFTRAFNGRFADQGLGSDRGRALELLQLFPSMVVAPHQVHGARIKVARSSDGGRGAINVQDAIQETDGLLTEVPDLALSIQTADCLPLFIAEPESGKLCLLHCGWKSVRAGIIEKGLDILVRQLGADPKTLEVVLGPSLQPEDFEVGEEFFGFFPAAYFARCSGDTKPHFDLSGFAKDLLVSRGVSLDNIALTGLSTFQSKEEFFSYRREGALTGRMLSLLWLEKK